LRRGGCYMVRDRCFIAEGCGRNRALSRRNYKSACRFLGSGGFCWASRRAAFMG
jgi:hypothetical protein